MTSVLTQIIERYIPHCRRWVLERRATAMKIQFKATVPLDADIIEIWDDVKGIHKTTLGGSGEGYIVYFVGNLNDGLNAISLLCNYEGVTLRAEVYK